MFHAFLTLGLAALALGSFAPGRQAPASRPASEARTQTVYVTVLGPKNAPVTGLSAADFSVREDNAPREVLKAEIRDRPDAGRADRGRQSGVDRRAAAAPRGTDHVRRQTATATAKSASSRPAIAPPRSSARPPVRPPSKPASTESLRGPARAPTCSTRSWTSARDSSERKAERPVIVALTMEGGRVQQPAVSNRAEAARGQRRGPARVAVGMPSSSMSDEMRNADS